MMNTNMNKLMRRYVMAGAGALALLTACNLAAICVLGKYVFRLVDDYRSQRSSGIRSPEYHRSTIPELHDVTECWPD